MIELALVAVAVILGLVIAGLIVVAAYRAGRADGLREARDMIRNRTAAQRASRRLER